MSPEQMPFSFIISTVNDNGKINSTHISDINSHCAQLQHARSRRLKKRQDSPPKLGVGLVAFPQNGIHVRQIEEDVSGHQGDGSLDQLPQTAYTENNMLRSSLHSQSNALSRWQQDEDVDLQHRILKHKFSTSQTPLTYPLNCWAVVSEEISTLSNVNVLRHCIDVYWPGFIPASGKAMHLPPWVDSWALFKSQGQGVFYSNMWQSAINLSFQTGLPITDPSVLRNYSRLLQYVSKEITGKVEDLSDDALFGIVGLSVPDVPLYAQAVTSRSAFRPPFPDIMWTSVFSRHSIRNSHMNAVYRIVHAKGGIDNIFADGLPQALNNMDLIHSTQGMRRPRLSPNKVFLAVGSLHSRYDFFGHENIIPENLRICKSDKRAGDNIDLLRRYGLVEDLAHLMQDLRIYCKLLQLYCDKAVGLPNFALLATHRSLLQHRVLLTLPGEGLFAGELITRHSLALNAKADVNDLCQTALLILSVCVTYPIYDRLPCKLLAYRLRKQLESTMSSILETRMADFVFWLCMLGALAAKHVSDMELTQWFTDFLCNHERSAHSTSCCATLSASEKDMPPSTGNISTWNELKDLCLKAFVWCDYACDEGAQEIWWMMMQKPKYSSNP